MRKLLILCLTCINAVGVSPAMAASTANVEQIKALNIKPSPSKALVYLYRAGSSLDNYKLYFDGHRIPALYAKSFIVIETDPGRHRIEAKNPSPGMNRTGVGSYELYTFEADQVYFIENVIGIDPRSNVYNISSSEFWKRKESHWLKVRDNLSFLDFVSSESAQDTILAETPSTTPQAQSASLPPSAADIPVSAASPIQDITLTAPPSPASAIPTPILPVAPTQPTIGKAVSAPTKTAPATPPVVTATPATIPALASIRTPSQRKPIQNPYGIAVIIGNRNYSKFNHDLPNVDYALNDAQAMYDYVHTTLGYREGNIIYLKDATQAQLLSVFGIPGDPEGKLFNWVRPKQSDVFVYYSGHGVPGAKDGRSYLLPVDADPSTVQINGYLLETLYANLAAIPAKSFTVVLDACFSGSSAGGAVFQKASSITLRTVDTPNLLPNATIFSATGQNEVASWDQVAKLGLLTRAFLEGVKGAADSQGFGDGDGNITLAELKGFLTEEVAYAARRNYGRKQTPQITGQGNLIMATLP